MIACDHVVLLTGSQPYCADMCVVQVKSTRAVVKGWDGAPLHIFCHGVHSCMWYR